MASYTGRPGRRPKSEYVLTDEQRAVLGRDQFFDLEEIAAILNVSEEAVRQTADRGLLPTYLVPGERRRVQKVKGIAVIRWRDALASIADEPETCFERYAPEAGAPLTDEQRAVLGRDQWFGLEEVAAVLNLPEEAVRAAVNDRVLAAYVTERGQVRVKGLEVIRWCDVRAGVSDGPEERHPKV